MAQSRYIGLMSGTSLDGVDAVLAEFQPSPDATTAAPRLLAHAHLAFDPALRAELLALNTPGPDEIGRGALAANALARVYAEAVRIVLAASDTQASQIAAIGCHGQTVRHQPAQAYTVQLVNGALLAELCGITVVCDFRSRDIAAGGQGAPLAPGFHQAVFAQAGSGRAVVNIGGIANITWLPATGLVIGFDCGPGNVLMDAWVQRHRGQPYDEDGAWAAGGRVLPALLAGLRRHPYFRQPPPKSTGRETFHIEWVSDHLPAGAEPADVQATLLALTVETLAQALEKYCPGLQAAYVCGGGARNGALMRALAAALPDVAFSDTAVLGVDPIHVEALAFAWLARQALEGHTGNLPEVTGASGPRVLGAIHHA